ncbi:XRE family transcriptional regulator [Pseudomonas monteilii]|uniref:XRE family transcriptional regulator n=1 Tax=Pseudomonas monteilii TaxID=76759 RepID=UPI0015FA7DE1|nr:XRE family transcriptional regulator [Pseudomonas monteilii]MBA6105834.1 ImmA/IrrE family metallo-endopeptidase [Pseudomonas monteilii]MCE0877284.1 XRE family transcriptional regulator [Pseudomonas monteilii]MCE0929495.1 XRE family transcriptional regulator [Pseudomonas monteilii]MCE1015645.1 XRE family transcriptional regulator [Pseudomonas monteilii]WJR47609.1 XRE family transcriptional regulator [Pseudomonas monteilii]
MNLQALGEKFQRYRNQLQRSVDEVAKAVAIDVERLKRIERGAQEPTGDEVLILADYYRCDFKFFISNEELAPFEQTETLYRAHGNEFSKEDRAAIQEFLYLCETEEFLTQELRASPRPFAFSPRGNYYVGHAEEAAKAFRQFMGHSDREVPRDIYTEFRSVGVHVFRRRLENSKISGVFVMHPIAGKCILVNYNEDVYRQRFSAAHEMAHCIFDSADGPSVTIPGDRDIREVRANRFASCYLMPPETIIKLPDPSAWTQDDAQSWANKFRVSCDALGVALMAAKRTDKETSRRIRGYRVPREAKIDPELPESLTQQQRERKAALLERGLSHHYVTLCLDAHSQGVISLGRLAEALLCSYGELNALASLYGRKIHGH